MNDILFNVEKIPVEELATGYDTMPGISHAIVKTMEDKILSFRSEDYALITNQQIIDSFSDFFAAEGLKFQIHTQNFRDVRFKIMFYLEDFKKNVIPGDDVLINFYVKNSYNGSQKYQFGVSVLRRVCTNGLTILLEDNELTMLHTPGADEGIAVEKSLGLIQGFIPQFDDALDPFYDLADQVLNPAEVNPRIEELIEETGFPIGFKEDAQLRAAKEIKEFKLEPSDWIVYNSLNYVLNHEAETLMGRKADKIDKEVLNYLLAY